MIQKLSSLYTKNHPDKISCLTVYDALMAQAIEQSSIDIALVGDSLGMVVKGDKNTQSVSMDEMIYHTQIVSNQLQKTYLIADMPYHSYQTPAQTLNNASKLITAGADMVKLEGGYQQAENIQILSNHKIPICGHLGLLPQSIKEAKDYKIQGKTKADAQQILNDALLLEKLGIELLVLECIPSELATQITQHLTTPTIGIGAGQNCNGQVLVITDILGLGTSPKFSKNFLAETNSIQAAIESFSQAVKTNQFP